MLSLYSLIAEQTHYLVLLVPILLLFFLFRRNKKGKYLLRLVKDYEPVQIESARDQITSREIPFLIKNYWREKDWSIKRGIVELLQDQTHSNLSKLMLDYLRSPLTTGDELLTKAIALGFIDERFNRFMQYYNDRNLLTQDIWSVLTAHGLKEERSLEPPPSPAEPKPQQNYTTGSPNQRLIEGICSNNKHEVQGAHRQGADINITVESGNYQGCSPLILAIMLHSYEITQWLIEQGADVNFIRSGSGQTPLWWAANHGNLLLAEALIQQGATVGNPEMKGETPLTAAASKGHLEMVRYLVERGADIHARLSDSFIEDQPDNRKAFHLAAGNGHLPVVEYLIKAGNDPNEESGSGYNPLMLAVENNFFDMAVMLIRYGADVKAIHTGPGIYIAHRGWTPLVFAVHGGFVRMIKLLIDAGADIHYRVPSGKGLLDFVKKGKQGERIIELLREEGLE